MLLYEGAQQAEDKHENKIKLEFTTEDAVTVSLFISPLKLNIVMFCEM